jgi:hypothetical protein
MKVKVGEKEYEVVEQRKNGYVITFDSPDGRVYKFVPKKKAVTVKDNPPKPPEKKEEKKDNKTTEGKNEGKRAASDTKRKTNKKSGGNKSKAS